MDIARAIRLELDDDEQANLKTIMEATGERTAKKAVRKALRLYVSLRKNNATLRTERDQLQAELERVTKQRDVLRGDYRDALGLD